MLYDTFKRGKGSRTAPKTMTQTDLNNAIIKGLDNVYTLSEQVYSHWYSELYTVDGEPIQEMFTARTLKLIEDDVMNLSIA